MLSATQDLLLGREHFLLCLSQGRYVRISHSDCSSTQRSRVCGNQSWHGDPLLSHGMEPARKQASFSRHGTSMEAGFFLTVWNRHEDKLLSHGMEPAWRLARFSRYGDGMATGFFHTVLERHGGWLVHRGECPDLTGKNRKRVLCLAVNPA